VAGPLDQLAPLTDPERAACIRYKADAILLHACAQGWIGEFGESERLGAFFAESAELVRQLDRAIQKFQLSADTTVYSGHGWGASVVGSLVGEPRQFIGLRYSYPGYISTSTERAVAETFLRARSENPVLLECALPTGQRLLPMDAITGNVGEAEYLLGRSMEFEIKDADMIRVQGVARDVLHLVLVPIVGSETT